MLVNEYRGEKQCCKRKGVFFMLLFKGKFYRKYMKELNELDVWLQEEGFRKKVGLFMDFVVKMCDYIIKY